VTAGTLGLEPLSEISLYELLHAFAAGETQPQAASLDVHVDVEEGTAQAFSLGPFR
jgi:hypothetical protein